MNIKQFILILFASFMLSGCATALLFTGTAVGLGYVATDINENYDGDGVEYLEDKYNSLLEELE